MPIGSQSLEIITPVTVVVAGGDIDDIRASEDGLLYWETASGTTRVVAVFPRPASGSLFTIHIPDTRVVNRYVVRIEETADSYNDVSDAGAVSVHLN